LTHWNISISIPRVWLSITNNTARYSTRDGTFRATKTVSSDSERWEAVGVHALEVHADDLGTPRYDEFVARVLRQGVFGVREVMLDSFERDVPGFAERVLGALFDAHVTTLRGVDVIVNLTTYDPSRLDDTGDVFRNFDMRCGAGTVVVARRNSLWRRGGTPRSGLSPRGISHQPPSRITTAAGTRRPCKG
jgi:hypothetical protein